MVDTRSKKRKITDDVTPSNDSQGVGVCTAICTHGDCSICLTEMDAQSQVSTLACGHTFHSACIITALRRDRRCPLCRNQPESGDDNEVDDNLDDHQNDDQDHDQEFVESLIHSRVAKLRVTTLRNILRDFRLREEFIVSCGRAELMDMVTEQLSYETDDEDE